MKTRPTSAATAITAVILGFCSLAVFAGEKEPASTPYHPTINPAHFSVVVDNPYFTLKPGTIYIYKSHDDDGVELNKVSVTDKTRDVMGVATRVVLDQLWFNGQLVEETYDWYAQDKDGNVWYFGEDSKEHKKGEAVSTKGSWEAGVRRATTGNCDAGHPQPGAPYRQEYLEGEAEDNGTGPERAGNRQGPCPHCCRLSH